MKRKAIEKLDYNVKYVFKNDVTFKYADDDEILRSLSGYNNYSDKLQKYCEKSVFSKK